MCHAAPLNARLANETCGCRPAPDVNLARRSRKPVCGETPFLCSFRSRGRETGKRTRGASRTARKARKTRNARIQNLRAHAKRAAPAYVLRMRSRASASSLCALNQNCLRSDYSIHEQVSTPPSLPITVEPHNNETVMKAKEFPLAIISLLQERCRQNETNNRKITRTPNIYFRKSIIIFVSLTLQPLQRAAHTRTSGSLLAVSPCAKE